ncbi:phosphatidylinositol-glycan biosynthesis class S protein [Xylariomycetidae sp. FL0641]|nr:phosphatidylinositol-glycan biosynthesis class S protein [Xylariomycetidae sp. FL0641]
MSSSPIEPSSNGAASEVKPSAGIDDGTPKTNTSTNEASAPTKRKLPPPEKSTDTRRRSFVIASFWLVVLLLGLPIWWETTKITRANLPLDQMMNWADGKACSPVFPVRIAIDAPGLDEQQSNNLLQITQQALDTTNNLPGHRLQLEKAQAAADSISKPTYDPNAALTIRLTPGQATASAPHPSSPLLEITYPPSSIPSADATSSDLATYLTAQIRDAFAEEQAIMSALLATSSIPSDQQPQGASQEITEALSKRMTRSLKYSRTYHLTFSLFTSGPSPSSWEIESAIEQYMRPVLDMLNPIHNFTIDTQVQLYAAPGVQSEVLTKQDLSSFINAAEWPLSPSIGGAPTVNFVVYIGNQTIGTDSEAATSQSWLIPQWGSVYLLSLPPITHVTSEPLKQPILTFTSHLLSLLGTPQSGSLPMRLSTLTRVRSADLLLRASSSLGSLARLSLALPSISIPSSVADGVAKSMHHLEQACSQLGTTESLEHARIAETEAERAFFEKSMVGQLYFPDEHKVAVYLPLLGPVGVPLIMGLLNELKGWKQRRQQKLKTT